MAGTRKPDGTGADAAALRLDERVRDHGQGRRRGAAGHRRSTGGACQRRNKVRTFRYLLRWYRPHHERPREPGSGAGSDPAGAPTRTGVEPPRCRCRGVAGPGARGTWGRCGRVRPCGPPRPGCGQVPPARLAAVVDRGADAGGQVAQLGGAGRGGADGGQGVVEFGPAGAHVGDLGAEGLQALAAGGLRQGAGFEGVEVALDGGLGAVEVGGDGGEFALALLAEGGRLAAAASSNRSVCW